MFQTNQDAQGLQGRRNTPKQGINMPTIWKEESIRQAITVPGKCGIIALVLALKDTEVKQEDVPVHMYQGCTTTKYQEENFQKPRYNGT